MYNRAQNVNKGAKHSQGPSKKKMKLESIDKHVFQVIPIDADDETSYKQSIDKHVFQVIPIDADDETSYKRNMKRLEEEIVKQTFYYKCVERAYGSYM